MVGRRGGNRGGFTLVEVLVALAIISIALLAALRVAGGATNSAGGLRGRLFADWGAENLLAEQRARGDWPARGTQRRTKILGGLGFTSRDEGSAAPNAPLRRVARPVFLA